MIYTVERTNYYLMTYNVIIYIEWLCSSVSVCLRRFETHPILSPAGLSRVKVQQHESHSTVREPLRRQVASTIMR